MIILECKAFKIKIQMTEYLQSHLNHKKIMNLNQEYCWKLIQNNTGTLLIGSWKSLQILFL